MAATLTGLEAVLGEHPAQGCVASVQGLRTKNAALQERLRALKLEKQELEREVEELEAADKQDPGPCLRLPGLGPGPTERPRGDVAEAEARQLLQLRRGLHTVRAQLALAKEQAEPSRPGEEQDPGLAVIDRTIEEQLQELGGSRSSWPGCWSRRGSSCTSGGSTWTVQEVEQGWGGRGSCWRRSWPT